MCDYSLEMYASRPARAGEYYVTTRFPTGSLGLTSPGDANTAICVACDSVLGIEGIPPDIQRRYEIGPAARAIFIQLEKGPYRDGLRFENGREVCLQNLGPGVRACLAETRHSADDTAEDLLAGELAPV